MWAADEGNKFAKSIKNYNHKDFLSLVVNFVDILAHKSTININAINFFELKNSIVLFKTLLIWLYYTISCAICQMTGNSVLKAIIYVYYCCCITTPDSLLPPLYVALCTFKR